MEWYHLFFAVCVQSLHLQPVTATYTGNIMWQEDYWHSPQYTLAHTQYDNSYCSTAYLSRHKTSHSNQLHQLCCVYWTWENAGFKNRQKKMKDLEKKKMSLFIHHESHTKWCNIQLQLYSHKTAPNYTTFNCCYTVTRQHLTTQHQDSTIFIWNLQSKTVWTLHWTEHVSRTAIIVLSFSRQ